MTKPYQMIRPLKVRIMPKKSKKPPDNSQESTLGPFAKALGDVNGEKPAEREPEEPESGGDGEPGARPRRPRLPRKTRRRRKVRSLGK